MDDFDFIVDWPLIQDWANLPNFFVNYVPPPGQEGIYSPLKTLFHAVNYHFFGVHPFGYHVVSLLVHFIGIYFVYKIIFVFTTNNFIAFLSGLFFALHPVQVEAITYMTASVDMIGIVFLFIAFYCYLKARNCQNGLKRRPYILSLIFAFLAVFTHELTISLPLLFLWYEFCFLKERGACRNVLWRIAPFFVWVGLYAFTKFLVLKSIVRGSYLYGSFYLTMLVTIKAWAKYVYLCLFPRVLTHNHIISKGIFSFDPGDFDMVSVLTQSIFDIQVLLALVVLGGILFFAIKKLNSQPLITFCIGWFFISLLPVSNIIPSGVFFGERYLYLGLLGPCLLLGSYAEKLYHRKEALLNARFLVIGFFVLICITITYSARTWIRNKDWHDEIVLYEAAVKANPQSALMHTDLGIVYTQYGKPDEAITSFHKSIAIRPDDPVTYFSLAEAYVQMGKQSEAKEALHGAIDLDSTYSPAYYNLATIYAVEKEADKAQKYLNKALYYYRKQGENQEAKKLERVFREYFGL